MPGLDLSSLNPRELRTVLEAARARNQADLTDEVLTELRSRHVHFPRHQPWLARDEADEVLETPQVWWEDLKHDADEPADRPRGRMPLVAGLAGLGVLAAGFGWWLSADDQPVRSKPEVIALASVEPEPLQPLYAAPAPSTPVPLKIEASAAPERAPLPPRANMALAPAPITTVSTNNPAPAAREPLVRLTKAEVAPTPPHKEARMVAPVAKPAVQSPTRADAAAAPKASPATRPVAGCRDEPTPADRVTCASPTLAAQRRRVREAQAQALAAGADPALVGHDEAAWRARRDRVSDPAHLARLYDLRLQQLQADARAAKAKSEPVI